MFDILSLRFEPAQRQGDRQLPIEQQSLRLAIVKMNSPSASRDLRGKRRRRNQSEVKLAMSRRFREGTPRGAPNKNLGTGALYSQGFALSRLIVSTNVFNLLKNTALA